MRFHRFVTLLMTLAVIAAFVAGIGTRIAEAQATIAPQTFSVNENTSNGTAVGTIAASGFTQLSVTGGTGGSAFNVNPASGLLTVANSSKLDFEVTTSFTLQVTAGDAQGRDATAIMTINLVDLPETPTVANQIFSVAENNADGTVVGTVVAGNLDAADTHTFSDTLSTGQTAFSVDSDGVITVADSAQLDFETTPSFTIQVQISDNILNSSSATMTIDLIDVNEFPVVMDDQTFDVDENSANGTTVGTVVADDDDGAPNLFYTDTGSTGQTAFLVAGNGKILVADEAQLDFETSPTFTVAVEVSDGINTATATMTINLNDINDPPTAVDDSTSLFKGGTVSTLDSSATSLLDNDSDDDGDNLMVTDTPVTDPVNGAVTLFADGTFGYAHDGVNTDPDSFQYEVCDDGEPIECSIGTVNITVVVPTQVYVDDDWVGTIPGDDPDGDGPATVFGVDSFGTIQEGIVGVANSTVIVAAGLYDEQLVIDKEVILTGSGTGTDPTIATIVRPSAPPTGGSASELADVAIVEGASGTIIESITFDFNGADGTRQGWGIVISDFEGPKVTDVQILDNEIFMGLGAGAATIGESVGVVSGKNADVSGLIISGNKFHGDPTDTGTGDANGGEGIYINPNKGTGLISILNNTFDGHLFVGISVESGNVIVSGNTVEETVAPQTASTHGIRVNDFVGGVNYTEININNNTVEGFNNGLRLGSSGDGGSTLSISVQNNNLTGNTSGIWVRHDAVVTANFNSIAGNTTGAEVMSESDGTLDASANWWGSNVEADVDGSISGPVDFTPFLDSGADADPESVGFQPDLSTLNVTSLGEQTQDGRIQEGIDTVDGSTVNVGPGTYTPDDYIFVELDGLQLIGDPGDDAVGLGPDAPEVLLEGNGLLIAAPNVLVTGFDLDGGGGLVVIAADGTAGVTIRDNSVHDGEAGILLIDEGSVPLGEIAMSKTVEGSFLSDETDVPSVSKVLANDVFNTFGGIVAFGSFDSEVRNNNVHDNALYGILVEGDGHLIDRNTVEGNGNLDLNGIGESNGLNGGLYIESPAGVLVAGEDNVVSNNVIQNNVFAGVKLEANAARTTISDNTITGNGGEIASTDIGSAEAVPNNSAPADEGLYGAGIFIGWCGANNSQITGNDIVGNLGHGIRVEYCGVAEVPTDNSAHFNNISGNTVSGVTNEDFSVFDAVNNWWSMPSGPSGDGAGGGDAVSGEVDYRPWLLEPVPDVLPDGVELNDLTFDQTFVLTEPGEFAIASAPQLLSEVPTLEQDDDLDDTTDETSDMFIYLNGEFIGLGQEGFEDAMVNPLSAFHAIASTKAGIGFRYDGSIGPNSRELSIEWNLIGTHTRRDVINALTTIQTTADRSGMASLWVPDAENDGKDLGHESWGGTDVDGDGDQLLNANPLHQLSIHEDRFITTMDGYWVQLDAPRDYFVAAPTR